MIITISRYIVFENKKHIWITTIYINNVREKIESGDIGASFVDSNDQLVDVFTKPL